MTGFIVLQSAKSYDGVHIRNYMTVCSFSFPSTDFCSFFDIDIFCLTLALTTMDLSTLTYPQLGLILPFLVLLALAYRVIHTQFFHPLCSFPGPWYLTSFSISMALVSLTKREPEYLMYLIRRYGSTSTIPPTALSLIHI